MIYTCHNSDCPVENRAMVSGFNVPRVRRPYMYTRHSILMRTTWYTPRPLRPFPGTEAGTVSVPWSSVRSDDFIRTRALGVGCARGRLRRSRRSDALIRNWALRSDCKHPRRMRFSAWERSVALKCIRGFGCNVTRDRRGVQLAPSSRTANELRRG